MLADQVVAARESFDTGEEKSESQARMPSFFFLGL
jgi:hypothetical protein